jgi:hypothetical protein
VDHSPDNPQGNKLGPSINEPSLVRSIRSSGYPLQGIIADKLKGDFGVSEEWGYIDRDTKEHRSLDIFAYKRVVVDSAAQASLALLIECKRSINPYVFFRNVIDREIPSFPKIAGLTANALFLKELGGNRVVQTSGTARLGLAELPFVQPGPPHCSAFAVATAQGDKIHMSGDDPYKSLILPLTKAVDHATSLYQAGENPHPTVLFPTLVVAVGVIDAPILVVNDPREAVPLLAPWVRVPRQEARADRHGSQHVYYVVDMVHSDFFVDFLSKYLLPFFNEFASRIGKQSAALLRGGMVGSIDNWRWDEVRPQP